MLNPVEIVGIAGGAALLIIGRALVMMNQRRHQVERALVDEDPMVRRAAIELIEDRCISRHVDALLQRALTENDPEVRAALARNLNRCDWRPGDDPRILHLRIWAGSIDSFARPDPTRAAPVELTPSGSLNAPIQGSGVPHEFIDMNGASATADGVGSRASRGSSGLIGSVIDRPSVVPDQTAGPSNSRTHEASDSTSIGTHRTTGATQVQPEPCIGRTGHPATKRLASTGYGVASKSGPISSREGVRRSAVPDLGDVELYTEFCIQRAITSAILEEAIRRVQAENDRLEALLARRRQNEFRSWL